MTAVTVVLGKAENLRADALIVGINPAGPWDGDVDEAIRKVAGEAFHQQITPHMPLYDNDIIMAWRPGDTEGTIPYGCVIFIVDEQKQPLRNIVSQSLRVACQNRCTHVVLPLMRASFEPGTHKREESIDEILEELRQGIGDFRMSGRAKHVHEVIILVDDAQVMADQIFMRFVATA